MVFIGEGDNVIEDSFGRPSICNSSNQILFVTSE